MSKVAELVEAQYQLGGLSTGENHVYERIGWDDGEVQPSSAMAVS